MANLKYYQNFVENEFGGDEDEFCVGERLDPIDEDKLEEFSKNHTLLVAWTGQGYIFTQDKGQDW